jgi:ferrochelatase
MPRYLGNPEYCQDQQGCTGILLTNLGTPDAPTTPAVRRYLAEFLSDPRVIELPKPLWWPILHGVILRTRPQRSAEAYRAIWEAEGSPLLKFAKRQMEALRELLEKRFPRPVKVVLGMRYGAPSIPSALETLREANARRLLVLPLYPQYSASTTASTFDAIATTMKRWRWLPDFRMVMDYHNDESYIQALAVHIQAFWNEQGRGEKLLISFHGLPKDYAAAGDPYPQQCHETARLVAERLQLEAGQWSVAFQSRFGPREWLKPYTDEVLAALAKEGLEAVDVTCPGFSADCLETLEEINLRYREVFLEAGGKRFNYIPALNDSPRHIEALADIVCEQARDWT